jgi:hypothetical protein
MYNTIASTYFALLPFAYFREHADFFLRDPQAGCDIPTTYLPKTAVDLL